MYFLEQGAMSETEEDPVQCTTRPVFLTIAMRTEVAISLKSSSLILNNLVNGHPFAFKKSIYNSE